MAKESFAAKSVFLLMSSSIFLLATGRARQSIVLIDVTAAATGRMCVINVYDGTSHSFIFFRFLSAQLRDDASYWSQRRLILLLSNREISPQSCAPVWMKRKYSTTGEQATMGPWQMSQPVSRSHGNGAGNILYVRIFCRLIGDESIANTTHFVIHFAHSIGACFDWEALIGHSACPKGICAAEYTVHHYYLCMRSAYNIVEIDIKWLKLAAYTEHRFAFHHRTQF